MASLFSASGSTKRTQAFLKTMTDVDIFVQDIDTIAQQGVVALAAMTPVESGVTAASWGYEIVPTPGGFKIQWTNDSIEGGVNVAILIQYGHATGNGAYISGLDYINPAIQPIFTGIAADVWRKVTTA